MAKHDDLDLDLDFDFDDDLFSDDTFSESPNTNSRTPVASVLTGVRSGIKDSVQDPEVLQNLALSALPEDYRSLDTEVQATVNNITDTYDEVKKELKPVAKNIVDKVDSIVPERYTRIKNKLGSWKQDLKEDEPTANEPKETDEQRAALEVARLFEDQEERKDKKDTLERAVGFKISQIQHQDSLSALLSINKGMAQVAGFHDSHTRRYQKKHLELQYQQVYIQRNLLSTMIDYTKVTRDQLGAISLNTSLPEFRKIKDSERFVEDTRDRFINQVQEGLFGTDGNISEITNRLKKKLIGQAKGLKDNFMMASSMSDSIDTSMLGDKYELTGGMAGSSVVGGVGGVIGRRLKETQPIVSNETGEILLTKKGLLTRQYYNAENRKPVKSINDITGEVKDKQGNIVLTEEQYNNGISTKENNGLIARTGRRLRRSGTDAAGFIEDNLVNGVLKEDLNADFTLKAQGKEGIKSIGRDLLSSILPGLSVENGLMKNEKLISSAMFDNHTQRSITEVIPAYLSHILKEIKMINNSSNSTFSVYDFNKRKLVNKEELTNRTLTDVEFTKTQKDIDGRLNKTVSQLYRGMDVDSDDLKLTKEIFYQQLLDQKEGKRVRMNSLEHFSDYLKELPEDQRQRLSMHLEKIKSLEDVDRRIDDLTTNTQELQTQLPALQRRIASKVKSGDIDTLIDSGLVFYNTQSKQYEIDTQFLRKQLFLDSEIKAEKTPYKLNERQSLKDEWLSLYRTNKDKIVDKTGTLKEQITQKTQVVKDRVHDDPRYQEVVDRSKTFHGQVVNNPRVKKAITQIEDRIENSPISSFKNALEEKLNQGMTYGHELKADINEFRQLPADEKKEQLKGFYQEAKNGVNFDKAEIKKMVVDQVKQIKEDADAGWANREQTLERTHEKASRVKDDVISRFQQIKVSLPKHKEELHDSLIAQYKELQTTLPKDQQELKDTLSGYSEQLKSGFTHHVNPVKDTLLNETAGYRDTLKEKITPLGESLKRRVTPLRKSLANKTEELMDVYGPDPNNPLLKALDLEKGYYKDALSGKPIFKLEDIKGPILDRYNRTVLSITDLKSGLRKSDGSPLELPKVDFNKVTQLVSPIKDRLTDLKPSWWTKEDQENVDNDPKSIKNTLTNMLEELKQLTPDKNWRDRDGNNERDGSWRSLLNKRNNKSVENKKEKTVNDKKERSNPLLKLLGTLLPLAGGLVAGIGALISGITGLGGMIGGLISTLGGAGVAKKLWDVVSDIDGPDIDVDNDRRKSKRTKTKKPKGKLGRLFSKMKSGARWLGNKVFPATRAAERKVLGTAARTIGSTALRAGGAVLGGKLVTGTAAAAGTVATAATPVVLSVGTVAAAGYGGYKLYQLYTDEQSQELALIRLRQYGFDEAMEDYYGMIFAFENLIEKKALKKKDNVWTIDDTKLQPGELAEIFQVPFDNKQYLSSLTNWYQQRFKPVYLKHVNVLFDITGITDLSQLDKLDKKSTKHGYLNQIIYPNGPYNVSYSPVLYRSSLQTGFAPIEQAVMSAKEAIGEQEQKRNNAIKTGSFLEKYLPPIPPLMGLKAGAGLLKRTMQDKVNRYMGREPSMPKEEKSNEPSFFQKVSSFLGFSSKKPEEEKSTPELVGPKPKEPSLFDKAKSWVGLGDSPEKTQVSGNAPRKEIMGPPRPEIKTQAITSNPTLVSQTKVDSSSPTPGSKRVLSKDKTLLDGSGGERYLKYKDKGVTLKGLYPSVKSLFLGMVEEYGKKTGKKVQINEGFRSYKKQVAMKKKYGKNAATPGHSLHTTSAIDIQSADANALEKLGLMTKYGFTRPVSREPWHIEPAGIQQEFRRANKDQAWAEKMIMASPGKGGGGWGTVPNKQTLGKKRRNLPMAKKLWDQGASIDYANRVPGDEYDSLNNKTTLANTDTSEKTGLMDKVGAVTKSTLGAIGDAIIPTAHASSKEPEPVVNEGVGDSPETSNIKGNVSIPGTRDPDGSRIKDSINTSITQNKQLESSPDPSIMVDKKQPKSKSEVIKVIKQAARKVGVNPNFLVAMAAVESGLKPDAKAGTSSASGLFQFLNSKKAPVWREQLQLYGKKYGLGLNTSPFNARANSLMGAEFLKANLKSLQKSVKKKVDGTMAYVAHFLGAGGAKRFYKAGDETLGINAASAKQTNANLPIFYKDKSKKKPRTVKEIHDLFGERLKTKAKKIGGIDIPLHPDPWKASNQSVTADSKTSQGDETESPSSKSSAPKSTAALSLSRVRSNKNLNPPVSSLQGMVEKDSTQPIQRTSIIKSDLPENISGGYTQSVDSNKPDRPNVNEETAITQTVSKVKDTLSGTYPSVSVTKINPTSKIHNDSVTHEALTGINHTVTSIDGTLKQSLNILTQILEGVINNKPVNNMDGNSKEPKTMTKPKRTVSSEKLVGTAKSAINLGQG